MSVQDIKSYIIHLPTFRVIIYHLYENYIPPKDPLRHYEDHHTAKKDYPISMKIRRKISDYMTTLNLCQSQEVNSS